MEDDYKKKTIANFRAIWLVYLNMYSCFVMLGSIQDSIKDPAKASFLAGTSDIGIGIVAAGGLLVGIISTLIFGYYHEKITEKYSRKKVFLITNLIWIICYFLIAFSPNFVFFMTVVLIAAIGTGAFVPIGFSIIGDSFSPKERGDKFGLMQVGLLMGGGWGLIWGAIFAGIIYIENIIRLVVNYPLIKYLGIDGWYKYHDFWMEYGQLIVIIILLVIYVVFIANKDIMKLYRGERDTKSGDKKKADGKDDEDKPSESKKGKKKETGKK